MKKQISVLLNSSIEKAGTPLRGVRRRLGQPSLPGMAVLLAAAVFAVSSQAAPKVDVAKFDSLQGQVHRANLMRTGVWETSGVQSSPKVTWEFKTGGPVRSSPVVVGGTVYVGSHDGNFYAIDAVTGRQKWKFEAGAKVSGSAAVVDGSVFFAAENGMVYRLNAADGSQVWQASPPRAAAIAGSPAVLYGTVFIGGGARGGSESLKMSAMPLYGLDINTGKTVWQGKGAGPQGYAAITTDGEKLFAGNNGSTYGIFDIATGKMTGNISGGHQARQFMSMTFANGKVYIPVTMRGAVMCVDKDAKNQVAGTVWYSSALDGQLDIELNQGGTFGYEMFTDLAVTPTTVFGGGNDGRLYTFDAETGEKGWSFETGGPVQSSPSVANGMIYFGSWDGNLYALDAVTGKLLWKQPLGDRIISSPWPADGAIYVGCDNGSVYCVTQ